MDKLKKAMRDLNPPVINTGILCKVTAYDENKKTCTCEPLNGIAKFFKVRLNSENIDSFILIPKVNSTVVVEELEKNQAYISMFSEIDKILCTAENIEFNGGNNGGLINISDLISKINNLENDINNLKTIITTWVPVPSDGGAALKALITTWSAQTLTPTLVSEIENEKIKH